MAKSHTYVKTWIRHGLEKMRHCLGNDVDLVYEPPLRQMLVLPTDRFGCAGPSSLVKVEGKQTFSSALTTSSRRCNSRLILEERTWTLEQWRLKSAFHLGEGYVRRGFLMDGGFHAVSANLPSAPPH